MSVNVKERERASNAVKSLRKKLDKLETKKAEHLSRIAELEVAKQRYDEAEAKKRTSTRAAELTALQQDKLLHLIYVTHALKFEGTTNKNEQVWIALTADFNAACQLECALAVPCHSTAGRMDAGAAAAEVACRACVLPGSLSHFGWQIGR
jgi:hypothetical protein